jgi:lipopolysaccharide heptosyltransferase II
MNLPLVRFLDRHVGVPLCQSLAWVLRRRHRAPERGDPRTILVMRGFGVGNLVLMTPTLLALHQRFPSARIDAITLESNRGFLERLDYVSRVWYLRDDTIAGFLRSLLAAFGPMLRARYDLFIDFEQFARVSALLGLLLMIPRRIGFAMPGKRREEAFTDVVPYPQHLHMMEGFYTLLAPLGMPLPADLAATPVATSAEEDRAVDRVLTDGGIGAADRVAVIHPGTGANFILRRWPEDRFAAVADYLAGEGFRIVLTGTRGEAEVVERVAARMTRPALNTVGRFSLGELLALLRRASLVMSNDTGPTHLAAAQGAPVVGLFGPNTPTLYGPRSPHALAFYLGLPCSPCMSNLNEKGGSGCTDNICMTLMTVEQVVAALSRTFEGVASMPAAAGGVRAVPGSPAVHPLLLRRKASASESPEPLRICR